MPAASALSHYAADVALDFAGKLDRGVVIPAVDKLVELVSRPEVGAAWERESACAGMSVGGLTRHLISQPVLVVSLLGAGPEAGAGSETIALLDHYARAPWVREDLDGETNQTIRTSSEQQAEEGVAAALTVIGDASARLPAALAAAPPTTYIPWQGWSLTTDDFLVTRLMEMVVHADDLAESLAVTTPDFGADVLDPVFRLLSALAVRRHGQHALVRTLTRPQRAPVTVSAF